MGIPSYKHSARKTIKPISGYEDYEKMAIKAKAAYMNEYATLKTETTTVSTSNKPDLVYLTSPTSGEFLFKITGDHKIEFNPEIKKNQEKLVAILEGITNYLPPDKADMARAMAALHYCYAAMQAVTKDSDNGGQLSESTSNLWRSAMQKAKECFY